MDSRGLRSIDSPCRPVIAKPAVQSCTTIADTTTDRDDISWINLFCRNRIVLCTMGNRIANEQTSSESGRRRSDHTRLVSCERPQLITTRHAIAAAITAKRRVLCHGKPTAMKVHDQDGCRHSMRTRQARLVFLHQASGMAKSVRKEIVHSQRKMNGPAWVTRRRCQSQPSQASSAANPEQSPGRQPGSRTVGQLP